MSEIYQQIAAAYEKDQANPRIAMTADDLPLSFESMTDEWLTAVLCARIPGAAVVAHELGAPDNGSTNRRRIHLTYNDIGQRRGLPTALFCKASHDLSNRVMLGISGAAKTEVTFYKSIRALLDIEAPIGFHAKFDPVSFNSIVMLGDISDTVTEFCTHETVVTRARAESQVRLLAKLHGSGYADARIRTEIAALETFAGFFANTLRFGLEAGATNGFHDAGKVIPDRLYKRAGEIWPATLAAVNLDSQLPATLAHGDVHLKNWYVAGNGEMGLGDWQICSRGHWGRDFAYMISTALTVEDRRAWEQDLLKLYLNCLALSGGPIIDLSDAWIYYRQQLLSALTWWTITLRPTPGMPDLQPRDITLEFIRRITTAMDDLDSLGAF